MAINLFGQSISQLRRWRAKQPLDHRQLNEPVEALNRMMTGVALPRQHVDTRISTPQDLHCVFREVGRAYGPIPLYYMNISWMNYIIPDPPDWPHFVIEETVYEIPYRPGVRPPAIPSTRFTQAVGRYEPADIDVMNATYHRAWYIDGVYWTA